MNRVQTAEKLLKIASRSGSRLGLERVLELSSLLGDPQDKLKTIHIAGTNGKGSLNAMLSAVLREQGYKVGSFTSPAMLSYNDQIRINGIPVSNKILDEAVVKAEEKAGKMLDHPTEFELLTVAAFLIFSEQRCDICLIECGMGGDTDSTNIIKKPLLSVITNVTLDHCSILGNTTAEIASHKAGIIKQGVPVFFGGDDKDAHSVIKRKAVRNGSKLYTADRSLFERHYDPGFTALKYNGRVYRTSLRGEFQYENLQNCISCVEILRSNGTVISYHALKNGLLNVHWEGRFETLSSDPLIVFDGAHNPDGMKKLCSSIKTLFGDDRPAVLIGVLADKDYSIYPEMLEGLVSRAFAVSPDNPRALPSVKLAECLNNGRICCDSFPDIPSGFDAAVDWCIRNTHSLLVIGSIYMYKDIKACAEKLKG